MTLAKIALTFSIAALAGSALGQPNARAAAQPDGDAIGDPWSDYRVENAALLYYRYWMSGEATMTSAPNEEQNMEVDGRPSEVYIEILIAGQETIRGYLKASRIKHADWGVEYEEGFHALLPHLGKLRMTARVLTADALRLLDSGEVEPAAERIAALFRMGEQTSRDRVLISSLVGVAITALAIDQVEELVASEKLTAEARDTILDALNMIDLDNPANVRGAVLGERDIFLRWATRNYTGPTAGADFVELMYPVVEGTAAEPPQWTAIISEFNGDQLQADIKEAERYYDDILSIWDLPDAGDRIDQLALLIENGHYGVAGRMVLPSMSKIWDSAQRIRREITETRKLLEDAPVVVKEEQSEDED